MSIFGGKLTDCLNVGDEVAEALAEIGVIGGTPAPGWFGEPSESERTRFYEAAAKRGLDRAPDIEVADTLAEVLWRRHGMATFDLLALIDRDPSLAEPALANSDVLVGELMLMAEREMIVHPDDFLRRRTKLAMVIRNDDLGADPGMERVNEIFGF
ncbi:MAG: glycerol-3-phosphate dehydrogenase C-terminal domain-containing protein [Acidimicrobiales bacterium]